MRFSFPVVSLLLAGFSLRLDLFPRAADSALCRKGGCRYDQIFAQIDASGNDLHSVAALLVEDPSNPAVWCTYGELLSASGETNKAADAFGHAVALGPGMAPVLMRAANFDFTHDRTEEGLRLAARILSQTASFDEILFSYLQTSGEPISKLLGNAVPATPRVARSWLAWLRAHGSDDDVVRTWSWMRRYDLPDEKSAVETASTLWQRKAYWSAQQLWADWLGARQGDYRDPQLLANTRFQEAPSGTPFDWSFRESPSVELRRQDGLEVRFLGQENIDYSLLEQFTTLHPGRYRFSADVEADNITTDEGPFFRIIDIEHPGLLSVETRPILGSVARTRVSIAFTVPAGTRAIEIQLLRRSSLRFDNKIAGRIHIHSISLAPFPGSQETVERL